ncbi:hypothetical protein Tco_0063422 [Tanacetum coccineum]
MVSCSESVMVRFWMGFVSLEGDMGTYLRVEEYEGFGCFDFWRYGYIKNHKKTVKNGQARTRESEEYKKKPKILSRSQKCQRPQSNPVNMVNSSKPLQDKTSQ